MQQKEKVGVDDLVYKASDSVWGSKPPNQKKNQQLKYNKSGAVSLLSQSRKIGHKNGVNCEWDRRISTGCCKLSKRATYKLAYFFIYQIGKC